MMRVINAMVCLIYQSSELIYCIDQMGKIASPDNVL